MLAYAERMGRLLDFWNSFHGEKMDRNDESSLD